MSTNTNGASPIRVMFVCLGNICRSPLAEGLFRSKVEEAGLEDRIEIASSGTGDWHVGDSPDARMMETASANGLSLQSLRAQQFTEDDFEQYDHIFVMDKSNLHDVLFLDEDERYANKVRLFREFDPRPEDYQVPDPYYGGDEGFTNVFNIVERTSEVILQRIVDEHELDPAESN